MALTIDWTGVDKKDAGVDPYEIAADIGAVVAAFAGAVHAPIVIEVISGVIEAADFVKSAVEEVNGHPSSLLLQATTSRSQAVAIVINRAARIAPIISILGQSISLYENISPAIQWR